MTIGKSFCLTCADAGISSPGDEDSKQGGEQSVLPKVRRKNLQKRKVRGVDELITWTRSCHGFTIVVWGRSVDQSHMTLLPLESRDLFQFSCFVWYLSSRNVK